MFNGDANPVLINVLVSHNTTSSSLGGYGGGIYNHWALCSLASDLGGLY